MIGPRPRREPTEKEGALQPSGLYSRKGVGEAALLLLTLLAFYLCWLLARPFLAAMTWALALAVVGHPLHRRLERRLHPNLAALISVIAITIILLAPGIFLLQTVFNEAGSSLATFGKSLSASQIHQAAGQYSFTGRLLEWFEARFDLDAELNRATAALAGQVPAILRGSMQAVTQFAIMLVILFYFFRDRGRILKFLGRLAPLSSTETSELFRRISQTIYATLYGNLVVKLIQGLLGGLMFWFLGLPAPTLFGAAMALLAMLPVVGTSLVWGPAAIYLLIHGSWVKALILAAWGGLVVSLIDNLLYPILVGGELKIHTLAIFVSVFGGLIAFGIAGVVLGPVILATTVALLEVWRLRTDAEPAS
jgi:predicted PurR-regulated permease PerM